QDDPPLAPLVSAHGSVPGVTAADEKRIAHEAVATMPRPSVQRSKEGVVAHTHGVVRQEEGVYGLVLDSGGVVSCYTLHSIGVLTAPGKILVQRPPKWSWGRQLARGDYKSVTVDKAVAQCIVSEKGKSVQLLFQDAPRTVTITGKR